MCRLTPSLSTLGHIDLVLILSVEPIFYGQSFLPLALDNIRELKRRIGGRPITIEVDGGITAANIRSVLDAGADMIVAGSAVFPGGTADRIKENIAALHKALSERFLFDLQRPDLCNGE